MPATSTRLLTIAAFGVAAALAGCDQKKNESAAAPATASKDPNAIPGLKDEKARASYMIGLDIAKTLDPVKSEIDISALEKGMRTALEGGKPLMDEKQAQKVREEFTQKLQAKRVADQMAAARKNGEAGKAFLAKNAQAAGVKTTASGLQYLALKEGTGARPKADDVVSVHYQGTLLDGTKFDSSYDRGQPASIPLGQVVPGWREGIQLMTVGSKYRLWLPANLAYGEQGTPGGPIGPNSTLVFEVELLGIEKPGAAPGPAR